MVNVRELAKVYAQNFDIVRANSAALLDISFRLRYQVYCVENLFLDSSDNPGRRETDEYDASSVHILLRHRKSGLAAGTARVIIPRLDAARRPLPMQYVLGAEERRAFNCLPRSAIGEISRVAISKEFRHWWAQTHANGAGDMAEQQLMRYIIFGLLGDIVQACLEHGVNHLAAVVEPALFRMLLKFGIEFEPLGGLVEYHGQRQPCVLDIGRFIENSRDRETLLWQFMTTRQHVLPPPATARPIGVLHFAEPAE